MLRECPAEPNGLTVAGTHLLRNKNSPFIYVINDITY